MKHRGGKISENAVCLLASLIQKSLQIYFRPRTGPQSAHLWWPAAAKLQVASVPIA